MNLSDFQPVNLDRATNDQLNLVNKKFKGKAPEVFRDIAELNFVALRFCKKFDACSDDELAQMSVNLVYQFASSFGGTQAYIPVALSVVKGTRNEAIKKSFTGNNIRYLSVKFKLSEMRIRQIIALNEDPKSVNLNSKA